MNLLGMIGGTSWHSTIVYYRLINEEVGKKIGTQGNPPLLLHSLNIELMRSGEKETINQTYLDVANKLQSAGAKAIIICANTPHMVYEHVAPKIDIPILHIAEATGREAQRQGLMKLGLLGNRPTMTGGFIQSFLKKHFGIETIIPADEYIAQSHHFVSKELTQGKFTNSAETFFLHQMELMKNRGADGVILGCTELPILLENSDSVLPMLSTTQLHVQLAVDFIMGE